MNYFELFDIPVQLKVDKAALHPKFIALSRQYHPDYFVNDGQEKLSEMMEISATLNKAYKTFQDPDATMKYVLQLKGLLEEEEKYDLPAGFLMEVLDINERVMDLPVDNQQPAPDTYRDRRGQLTEDDPPPVANKVTVRSLQSAIHNLHTEIYEPVKKIIENYEDSTVSKEELLQVKEYYYKKKYLDRIRRELAGKL